jgi:toxin FitB
LLKLSAGASLPWAVLMTWRSRHANRPVIRPVIPPVRLMFVLDTNVISELMRPAPHPAVFAWVAAQPRASLYTTSVTRAEILSGIGIMPQGRRRAALSDAAAAMFDEDLRGRILAFDTTAADRYAEIVVSRRQAGTPIHTFDALIAATALVARAAVVARDTDGFAGCGLTLINPWEGGTRSAAASG